MALTKGSGGKGVYGSINVHDGSTAQSVNNGAAQLITGFNTAQGSDGISNGTTPAKASNQLTLDNAGVYEVKFQVSFQGGGNVTWQIHVHDGGGELSIGTNRKTPTNDVGSCSAPGHYDASAGAVLTLYIEHDGGGAVDFTPIGMQLVATRVDDS